MNFDFNDEQAQVKAAVARLATGDLPARAAARHDPRGFAAAGWQRLAAAGVLALPVSVANGGLGGDRVALLAAMEALGAGLAPEPVLDVAVLGAGLLDGADNSADHAMLLKAVVAGETLVTLAHAERGARFELDQVSTVAVYGADGVRLTGHKTTVLAGAADWLIVSARNGDGIGLWRLRADAPGIDRRLYRLADGSVAAEIMLRGATVAAAVAGGLPLLLRVAALARAAAAAEMLGLMTLVFDATLAHVKTRSQFGQPLGRFQVIQHRMVDAYARVEQARSQVVRAMLATDADFPRVAAGAKTFVAETALAVAHDAVQLHGGMGITDELAIGHALKRIRVLALTFGDTATGLDAYRAAA